MVKSNNKRKKKGQRSKNIPKTRKEIRKDKRLQKKENKRNYFGKKNTNTKFNEDGKFVKLKPENSKKSVDQKEILDLNDSEEILSDFELSDNELNEKLNKLPKQKSKKQQQQKHLKQQKSSSNNETAIIMDRFHEDQQREKKKQKDLERKMRKRRIEQLKLANEEEDKEIRRLEKKLKIDKHKSSKSVHKMFSGDGLDYALELCLPENIEKMYEAAKEAAKLEENEEDDFEKDMEFALNRGKKLNIQDTTKSIDLKKKKEKQENKNNSEDKIKKKEAKLKKIESKYFKDDLDLDLGDDLEEKDSDDENDDYSDAQSVEGDIENKKGLHDSHSDLEESESEIEDEEEEEESDGANDEEEDSIDEEESRASEMDLDDIEERDSKCAREKQKSNISRNQSKDLKKKIEDAFIEENEESFNDEESQGDEKNEESFNDEESQGDEENEEDKNEFEENGGIWEDIYGRKRDKQGNIIKEESQKYIPPHARAVLTAAASSLSLSKFDTEECDSKRKEKLTNLRRSCKGFLNRLSEANMHKIASEIENLYMKNSRYDMNHTLCKLIMEALIMHVLSKERLVLEHTMLIAILHANIGSEIGAHFLQTLATKFDEMMKNLNGIEVENKELDNVVFILSHMYTFKVFQHSLIFEIINKLIENLCEKSVECLLLILRSIGFQLRKDDPSALKELILTIQKKAAEAPSEIKENPRLKFMLDILSAIKNNNMNKIPNYDPALAEHLKKVLKSMLVNGKYIATLNITLEDLLKADEKGKWWVVGSAWTGNINDIGPANKLSTSNNNNEKQEKFSEKLLELARKQRMNTDDRKNVFCILMSAEDYLDAFEKLLHLSIKDHRIIASILIHCCLSEKIFNPYYAVLGQKFCEYDRKYQLAIQFASWDRIKDIQSATKTQIQNLAQFLIHIIINGGLPISVLKIVEFAELDKFTLRLVRQIILGILLAKEDECKQVFERIAPSAKLNTFKDSIRLFMHHFLLKEGKKSNISSEQMELLKQRIGLVDKILEFIGSRVRF